MTRLIPYASLDPAPWKNGGGSTTEIAIWPPDAGIDNFEWRISLATISQSGPFSIFPGIDRTLALVSGPGVMLDLNGQERVLLCEEEPVIEFDGEADVVATIGDGDTTDFNIMTRRACCEHQLGRRVLSGLSEFSPRGDTTIMFLAEGDSLSISCDSERLGLVRYDAVVFEPGTVWKLETGQATVLVIDIFNH